MKTFLLPLLLTLITGIEAASRDFEVKACVGEWVDFICSYSHVDQGYYQAVSVRFNGPRVNINVQKEWKHSKGISVFHNTTYKNLRVIIRNVRRNNFGKYKCRFFLRPEGKKVKVETVQVKLIKVKNVCPSPSTQTAYTGAQTNIMCEFPGNLNNDWVRFLCKDNDVTCEDILTTESSPSSNGTFKLIKTSNGFNVSISNVSKQHEGVYWCGLKLMGRSNRAGFKRLQLKVKDVLTVRLSPSVGKTLTFRCSFSNDAPVKKFLCKGEDPDTCKVIVSTSRPDKGRFSLKQDSKKSHFNVTVRDIGAKDAGTYWCAAYSQNLGNFSQRFLMSVDVSLLPVIIPVVISVVVLLISLILVYEGLQCLKKRKEGQMKTDKEEQVYEEIQELPPQTNSGTALNTVCSTVPSAPAI